MPSTESLIEALCADEAMDVRRAAMAALARHYERAPAHYRAIAFGRLDDPDPHTRRAALRVIARLA